MLAKRIIPCLDVRNGKVVKGVNFEGVKDVGDPVECAEEYNKQGADELVFYDITASFEGRGVFLDVVRDTAKKVFVPLTVGGGIKTVDDIREALRAGADKVSVNSQAVQNPQLIKDGADVFGSQCICVGIDAKKIADNKWTVYINGGRKDMGVRQANLAVLRLTYMPSVLLEVGFISTPAEEQFLMSKAGQNLMAKSIYNAIAKYAAQQTGKAAKLEKPSATPVQPAVTDTPNDNTTPSAPTTTKGEKRTVYKVQVLAGSVKLKSNDKQFKGLKCEMHEKNGRYTYTYGSATTMDEAKKLRQSILDKFPQAFIVTFEE